MATILELIIIIHRSLSSNIIWHLNYNNSQIFKFEYHLALKAAYLPLTHSPIKQINATEPKLPPVMFQVWQLHSDRQGRIKETGPDHQQHD